MSTQPAAMELDDDALDAAQGGAETVHLTLSSNSEKIEGVVTRSSVNKRDIVVKGSKINQN